MVRCRMCPRKAQAELVRTLEINPLPALCPDPWGQPGF